MQSIESDWIDIPSIKSDWTNVAYVPKSTNLLHGAIKEIHADKSAVSTYPHGIIITQDGYGTKEEIHPDGTCIFRDNDNKEIQTIHPNGTINYSKEEFKTGGQHFLNIQATIYAVPTLLAWDDPSYIPRMNRQIPAGTVVGSFTRRCDKNDTIQEIKEKTIIFPHGSYLKEEAEDLVFVENFTCIQEYKKVTRIKKNSAQKLSAINYASAYIPSKNAFDANNPILDIRNISKIKTKIHLK